MVTMKVTQIIIHITVCFVTVWTDNKTYDWFDAQQLCRNVSKRLTTNASNSLEFIWTGRHKRFSQWIKILGCYNDSNVQSKLEFNITDYPSIGLCQEHCLRHHYSVYGLKHTECRCLQSDFNAIPLLLSTCNAVCSNGEDDILSTACGGEAAFNVFSTETGTKFTNIENPCIAMECSEEKASFHMHDCTDELGIICSTSEIYTTMKRWRDSFQSCTSNVSINLVGKFNLSNAQEACKIINTTFVSPLWIGIVREEYVSEEQGESILDRKLITKCQKCKKSHCEFVTCFEKNVTEVLCTDVSTPAVPQSELQGVNLIVIIGLPIAAFVIGTTMVIAFILCRRKKLLCKRKETPFTAIDAEVIQRRTKFSNKYKHFSKDDIRHLGRSNPSYVMTEENSREPDITHLQNKDAEYDELHQKTSRKIERSDIFHYSLHIAHTYDVTNKQEKKGRTADNDYEVAFTNKMPE